MNKTKNKTGPAESDWIHLRRVEMQCVLGMYPAERTKNRPVWMDISLACSTRKAAKSDKLQDTLDYESIEAEAVAVAKKGRFQLVEALAESVAAVCLKHPQVRAVRVVVDKPGALPLTQSVAVEIFRSK